MDQSFIKALHDISAFLTRWRHTTEAATTAKVARPMAPSLRWERNSGLLGSLEGGFAICTVISGKVPTYSMFAFKPLYNMKLLARIKEGLTLFLGRNCVKPLPAPAAIAHI